VCISIVIMSGKVARKNERAYGFRKGHPAYVSKKEDSTEEQTGESLARWMPRLTQAEFTRVTKVTPAGLIEVPDAEGHSGEAKMLRPRHDVHDNDDLTSTYLQGGGGGDTREEMRLYDKFHMERMYNECIEEHSVTESGGECGNPRFTVAREIKVGLCWQCGLRCIKCGYTSRMYKLYHEVETGKRGRKPAAPNIGLQVGLQESTTGIVKSRVIFASMNVPSPCISGMQKTANKVGDATSTMTLADLAKRREDVKRVNRLRGLPEGAPINIAIDSRYNTTCITGAYHAGQNASQAITVAVEKQTARNDIVGISIQNKLCSLGASLRRRGIDVTCPGHANCTATLPASEPLSEYTAGADIGRQFAAQDVGLRYIVTDGDAHGAEGVKAGMSATTSNVERQADTTHLGQSLFRNTMKAQFSERMFPGTTAAIRKEQKKMFSLDVKTRCHQIHSVMSNRYAGDTKKVAALMPRVIETTLDCYGGECDKCRYYSIVCAGGKQKNWWKKSVHLQSGRIAHLNMTDADRATLRNLIDIRLGVRALQMTKLCMNTNRNEGLNRSLSASLPKNVKFARNVTGRACAAIDRLNYGTGASLLRKLECNRAPITRGGRVARVAAQIQREALYHRMYMHRRAVRRRLLVNKRKRFDAVRAAKRQREASAQTRADSQKRVYRKGQLDQKMTTKNTNKVKVKKTKVKVKVNSSTVVEHPYCLRDRSIDDHTYPAHT